MKILSPRLHAVLDYVTVVLFALAPTVLGLTDLPALVAYVLAGVHLTLTLLTKFPGGVLPVVSLRLHGLIELIVGPALIALPWLAGFAGTSVIFYVVMGLTISLVWYLSEYANP
jgi:hypothetical protein